MKDHVADLYRALVNGGYNVDDLGGSIDGFREAMSDSVMRKEFYDWVGRRKNFRLPDYDAYESALASTYDGLTSEVTKEGSQPTEEAPKKRITMADTLNASVPGMVSADYSKPVQEEQEKDVLTQEEKDQRAAMRERLQADGTIDLMEGMKEDAREAKRKTRREAIKYGLMAAEGVAPQDVDLTSMATEHRQNKLLQEKLDVALDMARAGEVEAEGLLGFGAGLGLGIWDSATRLSTWDMGFSDIANNATLQQIVEKWENDPSSLTATEKRVLDGIGMATAVQELYSDQVGVGYNVGQSLPESAGFMASMALNPASGLGKSLARNAVRTYGRNSIRKNLYRLGGDFAETAIMTATTGAGRVAADALERINGSSTYEIGDNGVIMYGGQKDQETVGDAVLKAIGSNFIENYSEALGEYFDPLLGMSRRVAAGGLRKMNLNKWADALSDVQPSQMTASIRSLREKTKFGGIFGEIMEEEIGMALNAISGVGDYTFSKEKADKEGKQWIFDLENQLTTVLSCAIMSGTLNGVEQVSSVAARRRMEKNAKNAEREASYRFSSDKFAPLREAIDQASPEGMVDVLRDVYMSQEYTVGQKRALAEYASARLQLQYYNAADAKARRQVNKTQQELLDAQEAGLNAQLPQFFNIARAAQSAEDELLDYDGDFNLVEIIRSSLNRPEEMERILGDLPPRETQLVTNYIYSRARMEGAYQGRSNRAEDYVDDFAYALEPAVVTDAEGNRTITTAIMGDRSVYVLENNGDLAHIMRPDGSKTLVKASELTNITTSSADEVIDRYRDMYTSEYNAETENAFEHHPKTQAPQVGLQLQSPEGEVVITAVNDNMVEIVPAVYKDGQVQPKEGAEPRTITVDDAYAWQDDYYLSMDADQAYANAMAEASNMSAETAENSAFEQGDELTFYVGGGEPISAEITSITPEGKYLVQIDHLVDGLNKSVVDEYTADELRNLTTSSNNVSANQPQNEGTPTDEIKQSVSEEVINGQTEENASEPIAEVMESVNTPQAKAAELLAELEADEVDENIVYNTQKAIDLAEEKRKAKPTMKDADGDVATFKALKAQWQAELEDAQRNVLFWNNVAKEVANARVASQTVVPEVEAEAEQPAVVQPMDMSPQPAKKAKKSRKREPVSFDGLSPESMAIANGIMADMAPQNGVELAAAMMSTGGKRIIPESFRKHTGYSTTEQKSFLGLIAGADKGGLTIEHLGELVMQADREDGTNFFDQNDANAGLNAVLEVLGQSETIGDVNDYIKRNREESAYREAWANENAMLEAEQEAKDAWYMEQYHATEEELAAYNEWLAEEVQINVADEAEYERRIITFAEQLADEYDNERTNASLLRAATAGEGNGSVVEGSSSVGEEERTDNTGEVLGNVEGRAGQDNDTADQGVLAQSDDRQARIDRAVRDYWDNVDNSPEGIVNAERDQRLYEEALAEDAAETVETLDNGDVRRTNRNSNGEIATVAIERDGNIISVDTYDDGVLFEHTDYDANGNATKVTRYKDGKVVSEQKYKDGKRKVTANVFEMAEDAQREREQRPRRRPQGFKRPKKTSDELFAEEKEKVSTWNNAYSNVIINSNTAEEAIEEFMNLASKARLRAEDWQNRKYKKNDTIVTGQNRTSGADEYSTTIGAANERRRQGQIKSALGEAEEYERFASTLAERVGIVNRKKINEIENRKSNDKLAEKNHQQKENRSETRGVGSRPQLQDASSYESFVERVAEYLQRSYQGTELSEEIAQIIRDFNKGKTILARTEQEKALLKMLRVMTNKDVDWLLSELKTKRDSLTNEEERKAYDDVVMLASRYRGRGEHNAVVRALTGANLREKLPLSKIDELFEKYNSDADVAELYRRVRAIAEQIGLDFWFDDNMVDVQAGGFRGADNRVRFNAHMLYSPFVSDQTKASVMVHEILHAVADYAIETQEDIKLGLTPKVQLSKQVLNAANTILNIYEKVVKNNPLLVHEEYDYETGQMRVVPDYGTVSAREMLMEISNPEFRDKLKQIEYKGRSVWQRIWDAIKSMFTKSSDVTNPTAYDSMVKALDVLINEFSVDAYQKYSGLEESARFIGSADENLRFREKEEPKELIAVHNISEGNLKKVLEAGSLIMPSIAVTKADIGHTGYGEISLLFDKETINPSDRRNKVYGGDAWTPRFPQLGVKLNEKVVSRINKKIYDLIEDRRLRKAFSLSAELYPDNIKKVISDYGVEGYYREEWMKLAYLLDSGKRVKIPTRTKNYSIASEGIIRLAKEKGVTVRDIYNNSTEFYENNPDFVAQVKEVYDEARLSSVSEEKRDEVRKLLQSKQLSLGLFDASMRSALEMEEDLANGGPKEYIDRQALRDLIEKKVKTDNADYNKWVDELFDGIVEKRGVRNKKDPYTPSGNQRSWEQLYDDATPANILKYILAQNEQGGSGSFFDSNIMGASAETYGSIEEIREKGKQRLKMLPFEEYDEWSSSIAGRMGDICYDFIDPLQRDRMGGVIDAKIDITNAVAKGKTAKGIYKEMKRDYHNFTMEHAKQVEEIVKEIQEFATGYFEAKPQRLVSVNEVITAVVPSNTSKEIVEALKSNGIDVVTYKKDDEEARKRVVKRVSSSMGIRFRDGAPFFSNAERAVENIKQNKATPEQWLAMIKKDGGLKAGEDKWMGLSDWLEEKKADGVKSLTKDEVLAFIRENQIEIEEVNYEEGVDEVLEEAEDAIKESLQEMFDAKVDEVRDENPELIYMNEIYEEAFERVCSELGYNSEDAPFMQTGSTIDLKGFRDEYKGELFGLSKRLGFSYDDSLSIPNAEQINSTRLDYTTEGLDNKREIALVVPTIESWNESDTVHFGDAGEGRAVAWARFGETTDEEGNRVLVIDEVQSKRHDEGRAKGYQSKEKGDLLAERGRLYDKMYSDGLTEEEFNRRNEINARLEELGEGRIPDAPFDKNYHELVMKRMLRYAAENGFDKVAWTKGSQQAKRYGLNKVVDTIDASNFSSDTERDVRLTYTNEQQDNLLVRMSDGVIVKGDIDGSSVEGQKLSDIIGKDAADKLLSTTDDMEIKGDGLNFGGEDRNALYDEMIPRFMNKYTKKWGTKVGEVTLPNVEEAGRTMWSVDVTPEMRESVMQGQPMFREGMGAISDREVSYENDPIAKFQGKPRYYGKRAAAFAERERRRMENAAREAAEVLGIEAEIVTDASTLQGRKAKAKGWYDISNKKVVVVVPNHISIGDAVRTVLHEGIAHHGLRELFGDGFDAMLDNVYNNVSPELKARIDAIAERTGVSTSVATEEYLASLAETTNFEEAQRRGWWAKIKQYFVKMLRKLSIPGLNLKEEITDNELRYLLWRSYQNLVDPNSYLKPLGYIDDVAKQKELKVGEYAEKTQTAPMAADIDVIDDMEDDSEAAEWAAVTMQRIEELEVQAAQLETEISDMEEERDADNESRYEIWEQQIDPLRQQLEDVYAEIEGLYNLEVEAEEMSMASEDAIRYRLVDDPAEIDRLESEPTIKAYRAMQVINGELYPPMSAVVDGKLREPIALGQWEQSEERPDLADDNGRFKLDKGNKKSLKAAYNPYFHSSSTPLNDQFSEAQDRDNLVTVEVEVPVSEADGTSGYKAEKAKDAVGTHQWKAGIIQGQLTGTREVFLTRWDKPIRIVSESEVADVIVEMFDGKDIVMPSNVVTPQLRKELETRGITFVETDNQGKLVEGEHKGEHYSKVYGKKAKSGLRYRGENLYTPQELAKMETPIHKSKGGFKNLAEAEAWARENLQGQTRTNQFTGDEISVNRKSVNEMLAPKFSKKVSEDVHMKALQSVLDFIETGIPAEVHKDTHGRDFDVMRLYNAIDIDGKVYRVKSTVRKVKEGDKFYTYEVQKMELIEDTQEALGLLNTNDGGQLNSTNSISGAKLLKGVKKTNSNEEILPSDENLHNSEEIIAEVERESANLGVQVRIARSVDELPDEDTRKRAVDGKLKGYYDPRTNEVVLYAPNTDDANDAKRTILHEIVGHKGLRQLIGEERYDKAMLQLMYMLPSEVRDAVLRRAERHGWNAAIAMDEYLAEQAERDVQPTWWGKVNAKIRALFRNMGFNVMLTDADVTYLLWRSRKKLQGDTAFDMATDAILKQAARKSVNYDVESDNSIRHRGVEQGKKISEAVSDYYEKYTATTNADKFWGGVKYMATHLGDGGMRALLNDLSESQFEDIRSVRVLEEAIESAEGKPLRENEMVHKSLNAKTSRDARDMDKSQTRYFQPMAELLGKILGKKIDGRKIEIDDVERYLICKHSPENNEFLMKRAHVENRRKKIAERAKELMKGTMTEEEAIAQATSEYTLHQSDFRDDYSGLTELFPDDMVRETKIADRTKELTSNSVDKVTARQMASREFESYEPTLEDREKMAADEVARFEAAVDGMHEELWGIINGINRDTIERLFRSGLISRSLYNDLKKRHKFYVPLSGWKNDAAADIYNYAMYGFDGTPIQTVIKKAFGTKYQARNILGSMFAMNMAAITEGNQNLVKQKLYNLALNHDTGVLQIVDLWEVKDGEGDAAEWKPAPKPELRPTMSDAEMQKAFTDYQNKLMEMEKDGKARKAVNSLADNFGKHTTDKEAKRHHVELLVNGRKVVIWVNGNPKLAQAINGDLKVKKELLFFNDAVDKADRFLAQVQTSLSPEFMISNFERDILSASRYNLIKYGPKYEASFMKHLAQLMPIVSETNADMRSDVWGGAGIFNLFALDRNTNNPNRKPDAQVLDMNNPLHREFVNFLNYGGKTGYVERKQAEDLQQRIKKLSKREQSIIRKVPAEIAGWAVDTIEHLNEGIENATRFAAYLTARERGKSVTEAVFEAKEVSVNFNMQGSGAWGNASYRKLYNYFNVGLQSLRREKNLGREFPKAYIANLAFMMALGAISTVLLTADWDGDDEDEYMGLSDFNRYNYINVKTENGFIHYSLPQDLRAFYAIGCISTEWAMGKIDGSRAVQAYATQANNYTPLSFVSTTIDREPDSSPLKNLAMSFVPSAAVPVAEIAVNEDFLGRRIHNQNQWNEYEPEWQRAGYRTPEWVINASKTLSKVGGGTEHKRGVWFTEINPSNAWHIMDSYGGGFLDFAQKTYNLVERELTGEEHELRDYPMVSKFYVESGQDYSKQRVVNDRYRMYREDYETISNELNGYLKDKNNALAKLKVRAAEDNMSKLSVDMEAAAIEKVYSENVERIKNSPNYWIYESFEPYEKGYNTLERNLDKARKSGSEQKEKEFSGAMYDVRKKLVEKIDAKRDRWIDRVRQYLGN